MTRSVRNWLLLYFKTALWLAFRTPESALFAAVVGWLASFRSTKGRALTVDFDLEDVQGRLVGLGGEPTVRMFTAAKLEALAESLAVVMSAVFWVVVSRGVYWVRLSCPRRCLAILSPVAP